jgi:hypothetical protein
MRLILLALLRPRKAAEQLKSNPRWLVAFLILSIVCGGVYAVLHPYFIQATLAHLPSSATNPDKEVVIQSLNLELPAKLAFLPVRLFIGWSAFALVLLYACEAFAPREIIRFQQMFSLEVHSEATMAIANMAALVITITHGHAGLVDVPFSLAGFTGGDQTFIIRSLLTSLNIFTLWQVVLLTIGVSTLSGFGKIRSTLIVLLVWTLSTMFNLGAMKLLQDQLHLLL